MRYSYAIVLCLALLTAGGAEAASIAVYIGAPGSQVSPIAGSTTETFNAVVSGNTSSLIATAVGNYISGGEFRVQSADQYGGANGSKYMVFGVQSGSGAPVTLTLPGLQSYFGFWWSAGDSNNGLTFYKGDTLLARFSTADVVSTLPKNSTVQAVDGSIYATNNYYGNPNSGRNTGEPYSYMLFFGQGVQFDKIVLDNSGVTNSGFESDNHSIYAGSVTVPGSSVFVRQVTSPVLDSIPEPQTALLAGAGLALLAGIAARRQARG